MQASAQWLLDTLSEKAPSAFISIHNRHLDQQDSFQLHEVLSFLRDRQQTLLFVRLRNALASSIRVLQENIPDTVDQHQISSQQQHLQQHVTAIHVATDIIHSFIQNRSCTPDEAIVDVICDLHSILLALPDYKYQDQVVSICEWLWRSGDDRKIQIAPQTILYLLIKTFDIPLSFKLENKQNKKKPSIRDVKRLYAMRTALDDFNLSESEPSSETVRKFLLQCPTSPLYVLQDVGSKFLAYLLNVDDICNAVFNSILVQLSSASKRWAEAYGKILFTAWKLGKSQRIFTSLTFLTEKALYSAIEPLGTNLRIVLQSFHHNKNVQVDELLHRMYGPILYKNLKVANPYVRRNAITVLTGSFPIHDPNSLVQDIERTIAVQCNLMLDLLTDPAPIVRRATISGVCRILHNFWELVPNQCAKRMLDIITTKLVFDSSSSINRISALDGLRSVVFNMSSHQILAVILPGLGPLLHDGIERVRLAFFDLLLSVKAKCARSLRYTEIVSLSKLMTRLPLETPAVAAKIMDLVAFVYFPLEKSRKTAVRVEKAQLRACRVMVMKHRDACDYFYRHLYQYHSTITPVFRFTVNLVPFVFGSDEYVLEDAQTRKPTAKRKRSKPTRRTRRSVVNDENQAPTNEDEQDGDDGIETHSEKGTNISRKALLSIIADLLVSMLPQINMENNHLERDTFDDIFGDDSLSPYLSCTKNSMKTRAVCWRIASCISVTRIQPVVVLWREELDLVLAWNRETNDEVEEYAILLSALSLCAFRWQKVATLSSVISSWSEVASFRHRNSKAGSKSRKKGKGSSRRKAPKSASNTAVSDSCSEDKTNAVFALRTLCLNLINHEELSEEFRSAVLRDCEHSGNNADRISDPLEVVRTIRNGLFRAFDDFMDSHQVSNNGHNSQTLRPEELLEFLSLVWKLLLSLMSWAKESSLVAMEVHEMLQWLSGPNLLSQAVKVGKDFACVLSSMILRFSGDLIAIDFLQGKDMDILDKIVEHISTQIAWGKTIVDKHVIFRLLRLSYHLREQYNYMSEPIGDEATSKEQVEAVRRSSISSLTKACEIMKCCEAKEENFEETTPTKRVDGVMRDTVISFLSGKEVEDIEQVIGPNLADCLHNSDPVEENMLVAVACYVVRDTAMRPLRRHGMSASAILEVVMSALNAHSREDEEGESVQLKFISVLVDSVVAAYESSKAAPSKPMKDFFAALEASFRNQCDKISKDDDSREDRIRDVTSALENLKKL